MAGNSLITTYCDILRAFGEHETAASIEQDHNHGLDVTDALYEALMDWDEVAAEQFLEKEDAPPFPGMTWEEWLEEDVWA